MRLRIVLGLLLVLVALRPAAAFEPMLLKESAGADANLGTPCLLTGNTSGTAANYRWYNICSNYIWIYPVADYESFGVLFGGVAQPEVTGGNLIKRAITYWRNVVDLRYYVNVYVDADIEGDGCPDYTLASDIHINPGLRWNCSEFNVEIPCDIENVVLRMGRDPTSIAFVGPSLATDGPFTAECSPNSPTQSFYYGLSMSVCVPWVGPDGDPDNFLCWLIVDAADPCPPNAAEARSWGAIKGLFR